MTQKQKVGHSIVVKSLHVAGFDKSRYTFHHHLIDSHVILLTVHVCNNIRLIQSAFPEASFCGLSDVHECPNDSPDWKPSGE